MVPIFVPEKYTGATKISESVQEVHSSRENSTSTLYEGFSAKHEKIYLQKKGNVNLTR